MIKKLTARIGQYKKQTIATPLFMVGEVGMEVLIPLIMSWLIDRGIERGDMSQIWINGLLLLAAAFISLFFGVMGGRMAATASAGFAKNLRHDMYYTIQDYSFANIDKFSTSSIITRLTTDVNNVQNAFQMIIRIAVRAPMTLIFSMVMAFSVNGRISMVFLYTLPVLALGIFTIMRLTHPIFRRVFKTYDKLNNVVQENLRGVRVVKSFVREDYEVGKFNGISGEIFKDFTHAEKNLAFMSPLMMICIYTCTLLITWMGAKAIIASGNNPDIGMTTGQLMSLITYVIQILSSLMMVSMVFLMITMSRASAQRIVEVLDEKSDVNSPSLAVTEVLDGSIDFDHVDFSYASRSERNTLSDIDLHIRSGMVVGILGGTGSGKSSLVQLIPRLYDPTAGMVKVGGVDARAYDLTALRDSVAMVLQKNELFSGTIKDNLRWGNENATDEEIMEACRLAQADGFIQDMPDKYDTWIEQGGTNVSGGQKQRLCIARALLKKPKILILDDSTSAVDTRTDAMIRAGFRSYIPDTTKIIIAQRVSSVKDADMIVVLDDGRMVDHGTHEELMERCEIYREVHDSQTKGGEDDE
ncbi:MAG: ABC transporter ATP-binding protein [Clostridia bacterium]|nr:ABC transporter ATP-binding protein [Clostridia bacterium]MBR5383251.1 ABC transporter ATP-binding protein [Clostridia bacterium]